MTTVFDSTPREALADAVEASRFAWMGLGASWPGWAYHDDDDLLWRIAPSLAHASMNTATRARFSSDTIDSRLAAILGEYTQRGLPLVWWVSPSSQPADLRDRLTAHGLVNHGVVPGMVADLTDLPEPVNLPGFAIRPVEGQVAIRTYMDVIGKANDHPQAVVDAFVDFYDHILNVEGAHLSLLLGWLDGTPVSTAALFVADGIAGVYNICTVPAARRRGLGAAMTIATMQRAIETGFAFTVLQASDMAVDLYRALGFVEVCAFDYYVLEG